MDQMTAQSYPWQSQTTGAGRGAAPMFGSPSPRPLPWMQGNGTSMYPGAPRPMPWSGGQPTSSAPWGSQGGTARPRGVAFMPGYGQGQMTSYPSYMPSGAGGGGWGQVGTGIASNPGSGQVGTLPSPMPVGGNPSGGWGGISNGPQPYPMPMTQGGMTGGSAQSGQPSSLPNQLGMPASGSPNLNPVGAYTPGFPAGGGIGGSAQAGGSPSSLPSQPFGMPPSGSPGVNPTGPYTPGFGTNSMNGMGMGIGGGAVGTAGLVGGPQNVNSGSAMGGMPQNPGGGNFANPVGNNTTGNGGLGNIQQGVGQVAHDMGQFNNYGQLDASGTRMWAGSGAGGGQGAWQTYNPNDQNQSAIHNMFQRYGSGWYSGNPTAQGHYDDMAPQFQALYGRQGTPQELNDLYMGVVPGQQQAAHNAFAAQSSAYNPASSSYDPNAVKNLTSLNLLARQ